MFSSQAVSSMISGSTNDRLSIETAATGSTAPEDEPDDCYWLDGDWIPTTKSGKQRTPNMIRNELQKYIDSSSETQTAIVRTLGVNNNSFRTFMNPKSYKNPHSAYQNGTYWAAARFLEAERVKKTKLGKRKASNTKDAGGVAKKTKSQAKDEMSLLMIQVSQFQHPTISHDKVYDSCPEIVKKVKEFTGRDGVTKAAFCRALNGLNSNSLNSFMSLKKQDGAAHRAYHEAWVFFEKLRVMNGEPKSKKRLENEVEYPDGFPLEAPRTSRWIICAR